MEQIRLSENFRHCHWIRKHLIESPVFFRLVWRPFISLSCHYRTDIGVQYFTHDLTNPCRDYLFARRSMLVVFDLLKPLCLCSRIREVVCCGNSVLFQGVVNDLAGVLAEVAEFGEGVRNVLMIPENPPTAIDILLYFVDLPFRFSLEKAQLFAIARRMLRGGFVSCI
jgi:hypothetical protein